MTVLTERHITLGVILCAAFTVIASAYPDKDFSESESITKSQDVRVLDRRISSLEQRLYSIEVSINRLEQSAISQRAPVSQPGAFDRDINLLQGDVRTIQLRLSEIECGLAKLDERTLTPAVREARGSAGPKADPCRLNPGTPLRLSNRP